MQPVDIGDETRSSRAAPAQLDARIGAAVVDSVAVGILTTLFIGLPLLLTGLMTPTIALCGAVLIWTIAPLWLFRQTVGMKIFGIEMISKSGHSADLTELLFRELVGRGYLPAIYLVSLLATVVLRAVGYSAGIVSPTGFALIATGLAFLFLALAVVGNGVALIREDRRTLADIVAKTMVIPRRDLPPPEDEDDRQLAREERFRKVRGFVIFSVIVSVIAAGAPFVVLLRPGPQDVRARQAKLARQKLELAFKQNPANRQVAVDLQWALRGEGEEEKATAVIAEHEAAAKAMDDKREAAFKHRLAQNADDDDALNDLISLQMAQGRKDDARTAYQGWVDAHPTADEYAGFGQWLFQRDFNEEAVTALNQALTLGDQSAETHGYLGFALVDLGRKDEAKKAFSRALELDPTMEQVEEALSELAAE